MGVEQTKFDEAKLKGRAAKITCPNCSHKFVVRPETEEAPAEPPEPPSPEPEAAPDIFKVDFRRLGVAWKVRKGLGLTYEFHSLQQLQDMLQEHQVAPQDSISYDAHNWRSIESIPDIEAYFEDVRQKALAGEISKPSDFEGDDDEDFADAPTTLVRPGSSLADEIRRTVEETGTPKPVMRATAAEDAGPTGGFPEPKVKHADAAPTVPLTGPDGKSTPIPPADDAPTARITPISRRRSTTLMDIVLIRPMLPTAAARVAILNSKITIVPNEARF